MYRSYRCIDAMPGPSGDCPSETATRIVTDVELPTFNMQLNLPELDLNVSFKIENQIPFDESSLETASPQLA